MGLEDPDVPIDTQVAILDEETDVQMKKPFGLFVYDQETTTGFSGKEDRVIQIAVMDLASKRLLCRYVKPMESNGTLKESSPAALSVHGIATQTLRQKGKRWNEVQ
jgi:hypothetical protein